MHPTKKSRSYYHYLIYILHGKIGISNAKPIASRKS